MRIRKERDFVSCFDSRTGAYHRTGILVDGRETEDDPFMASFPKLLDIGIMGHCRHGQSGLCLQSGIQCYQNGLNRADANMRVEDFRRIISECRENTYQVALGGCGDPDQHEAFEEILKICRDAAMVLASAAIMYMPTPVPRIRAISGMRFVWMENGTLWISREATSC